MEDKSKPTEPTNLVGQYFHSITDDGSIQWQGTVIGNPEPGWYLLQIYEWLSGSPYCQHIMRIEKMHDWLFYDDQDDLIFSYERGAAYQRNKFRKDSKQDEANV